MKYVAIDTSDYIEHHGILGQKWGVRRYQNSNGSLTSAGKKRYNTYRGYKTSADARTMSNASIRSGKDKASESVKYYGGKHAAAYNVKKETDAAVKSNKRKGLIRGAAGAGAGGVAGLALGLAFAASNPMIASSVTGAVALYDTVAGGAAGAALARTGMRKANKILKQHADEQIAFINDEGDSTNHTPKPSDDKVTRQARKAR